MTEKANLNRRQALTLGAAAAAAGVAGAPAAQAKKVDLDFKSPTWNRDAMAKLQGNLDPEKEKVGWYGGKVLGVRPGEKVQELFRFEGFSMARLLPQEDGSYRKVLREVGFYRDIKTNEIMSEYENPYTGETVRVVPIANDPFNYTISEFFPQPPSYGGLNPEEVPRIPYILPWSEKADKVLLTTDIHLYYPAALQPDKWPRESPGPMVRVSEMFRYVIDRADLMNPDLTSIEYHGVWNRVTPWLPWMLMDQAPGHCLYVCDMGAWDSMDVVPEEILEATRGQLGEKFLSAPTEDYGPSLSSLERYALEQEPAPPKAE
ncbi:MAG: DUF1838 family protein [Pseudomonadota bacterium]